jgi:hypothetical protein
VDNIRAALAEAIAKHGNPEAAARHLGLPVETVRRVAKGKGLRGENYVRFSERLGVVAEPIAAPVGGSATRTDPAASIIATGQAEAAACLLEFAARLFEAGAQQLRQGVKREDIINAVEQTEAQLTRHRTAHRRASEA